MKRKTAKEILAESFRELTATKPVDKITVPNIIENCGYSKTTFYRLFKDKYDLMAWDYAQKIQSIVDQNGKAGYEWKQILWDVALLFNEQKDYLRNLLLHTSGYESFSRYMKQIHIERLSKCILDACGELEDNKRFPFKDGQGTGRSCFQTVCARDQSACLNMKLMTGNARVANRGSGFFEFIGRGYKVCL